MVLELKIVCIFLYVVIWNTGNHVSFGQLYLNASIFPNAATDQLLVWSHFHPNPPTLLTSSGSPVDDYENILTAGPNGPMLMQDYTFLDEMQSFNRERIPERVVHAKGAGAFGYLEVTNDISQYSSAKIFSKVNANTSVVVRFSRVGGEIGSTDTVRDVRGFALKFYTEDGAWDLVCNDSPIFFLRDPIRFPNMIHAFGRNPMTHLLDPNAMWDFISLVPETLFQVMMLYTDRGIPNGYRYMHGHGINTFFLVNASGNITYAKFHLFSNQGLQSLSVAEAQRIAGIDPDYFNRDLFNAIEYENLPSWNFSIQVMTPEQAKEFPWNPFDPTKMWFYEEFPLIPIGKLVLNRNPYNYFTFTEMLAFNPGRLVPGIEPSPDKILQGRLFAYSDAQTYRLGPNYQLLITNNPNGLNQFRAPQSRNQNPLTPFPVPFHYYNYERDGFSRCGLNQGDSVNYFPNSFNGPRPTPRARTDPYTVSGKIGRYSTLEEDNVSQTSWFWNEYLTPGERTRMVANLASSLHLAYPHIQERVIQNFNKISPDLGEMIATAVEELIATL